MKNFHVHEKLIDEHSAKYREAVNLGDRLLKQLEIIEDAAAAAHLQERIKKHKIIVDKLRIEFNRGYGPKSVRSETDKNRSRIIGPGDAPRLFRFARFMG